MPVSGPVASVAATFIWSKRLDDGSWSSPINLGTNINTPADEDFPFIHPDKKTLYFHSEGHNTMGGKDIFRSRMIGSKWGQAENMGVPVNTPFDDGYLMLTPDGKKGYLASNKPGGQGGYDLYFLGIPEEQNIVPLTVVKGEILAGDEMMAVPTTIKVVDRETGKLVRGIYNPDPETGKYLLIFPPGKNYDMIVQAEGYQPHLININIPDQSYFYELYQQIRLKPIKQFDEVVGQEIIVKNAFYDTHPDDRVNKVAITPRMLNEAALVQNDSVNVAELLEVIIASEDKVAYEYLLDLMFKVDPMQQQPFEDSITQSAAVDFFYEDNQDLQETKVGNETVYTLPAVDMTSGENIEKLQKTVGRGQVLTTIYFASGRFDLKASDELKLKKALANAGDKDKTAFEIAGYADATGNAKANQELSNKRATQVLHYLQDQGIPRRRIVAKGFGQIDQGVAVSDEEARRVELRLVQLQ